MSVKILIIADDTSVLRELGYTLGALDYDIVSAESAREGFSKMVREHPNLVIVDSDLPDMPGTDVCREMRRRPETSDVPIIMLSGSRLPTDQISGLKAGANEYVTKPVHADEVAARVEALLNLTCRLRPGSLTKSGATVALIGAKGGVGTTTIALNLAATLAMQKKTTMAVELRSSFGTCAVELGLAPPKNLSDLLRLAPESIDAQTLRSYLVRCQSDIAMLFGPQRGDEFQEVTPEHTRAILNGLASMAAYTVIDLPSHLSLATIAAIQESDCVIVIVEHEGPCKSAAKALLDQLASWGVSKGQIGIIVVKRSADGPPLKAAESHLELGYEVLGIFPPAEDACRSALAAGAPIVLSQPGSAPATDLIEIGRKVRAKFSVSASV